MTLKTDILRILNGLKVPSFIVDKDGRILHSNSEGEFIRQEYQSLQNISELFNAESSAIIKQKISESIESLKTITTGGLVLSLGIRGRNEAGVSISSFEDETRSAYAVCTFQVLEAERNSEKFEFNFSSKEFKEIIKDEALRKVFDEIKSSFPFTFLGKSRIQNEINRLDEFFWLKDPEGRYILVNLLFAQFLGLKPGQLEGKYEKDFVPRHFSEMLLSVDKYIKETANTVIRNGFPLYQLNGEAARIIELPLCDLDNKVIATLCVSQKNFSAGVLKDNNSELLENALRCLPKMVIIADKDGIVKSKSGELLDLKTPGLDPGMPLVQYMPAGLGPEAERFLKGGGPDKLELKKEITTGTKVIPFVFNFRKIYNYRGKPEGFLLFIEEDKSLSANSNTIGNKEKMYEILMQTSPEPMFVYDIENLRFLDVNQAALQVYGYSRHEFLQMDLTDLYAPEDIQTLLDTSSSRNKEGVFTGPWRHRKKDGSSLLVEISRTTFDYQGKKAHFNIVRDVTQKAELEKNSQFFNAAFNTISDLIFITDPEGFITKVNDSVTSVLGYSRAELDMRPFLTLASDRYRAEINTSIFYSKSQKPVNLDAELKKSDGSLLDVSLSAIPVFDYNEQVSSFSVVVRAKKSAGNSREAEVSYTGNKKQTEDALAKKPHSSIDPGFLSSMFHEILTPMNVILGFIQELTENIESPTQEQKESIDIINQNRTLLMQTMDSVLEYSHIEQNRVDIIPQRVFFTEIVDELQKDLSRVMSENKIMFNYGKISTSLNFETDRHRMESFLAMFMKMAMRITKEGSVFISAYQYDDRCCLISLKDRRGSISPYLLENIAELFTAEEQNIKKDFGVSKLTIRLARRLLELLLGKVEVVKRSGEPSEFGFLFPLVYKKPDEKGDEPQAFQSAHTEESSRQDEAQRRDYAPQASSVNEEDMDIIEEGEITGGLEEALNQDEPVKVFDPDIKDGFAGSVTLPRAKAEEKPHTKIDLAGLQCLYVEDQVDSQILFRVQMKDLKHVDAVASFEAALPLLEENKYDFIVMDINLQGEYNGLDALRIIRRLPGYRNVPVIAVTAYILAGDKEKFIAAGFNGFISKPVMRDKVMETLEKII
ncbi:MAG: PAS domain S-box protein [Ignavibacteria bacterium]|jgi:PAS domain S-box-containing protein|nr:PAS domain S-box protein [Ignavibacteria bacterium]MCU7497697.1 PAS domain S-box protein [Ignavibacteria bacterium]MCU7510998.1 PAS domain S-box protein [Ignavibacteria bacterium]MCU7518852.1 PAS domain S-box protein [Ignavibacteria bacterium]